MRGRTIYVYIAHAHREPGNSYAITAWRYTIMIIIILAAEERERERISYLL